MSSASKDVSFNGTRELQSSELNLASIEELLASFLEHPNFAKFIDFQAIMDFFIETKLLTKLKTKKALQELIKYNLNQNTNHKIIHEILQKQDGVLSLLKLLLFNEISLEDMESIGVILLQAPPSSQMEYFRSIANQLINLLTDERYGRVAAFVILQFVSKRPKLSKKLFIDRIYGPLTYLFELDPVLATGLKDLDGNMIISTEEQLEESLNNAKCLLVGNDPSPHLIELSSPILLPLFLIYQSTINTVSTLHKQVFELIAAYLKLTINPHELLLEMSKDSVLINTAFINFGSSGGVTFSISENHQHRNVVNPKVFLSFLKEFGDTELISTLFITLLQSHLALKRNREEDFDEDVEALLAGLILEILNEYGIELVKNSKDLLVFIKTGLLDDEDLESLSLSLSFLSQVLGDGSDIIEFEDHEMEIVKEIKMIIETLVDHFDPSVSNLAMIINHRLIASTKSEPVTPSETVFNNAMAELSDELVPIRAHGISLLRELIVTGDKVIEDRLESVLLIFTDLLNDTDSFIYLNAVKGWMGLSESFPGETVDRLVELYKCGISRNRAKGDTKLSSSDPDSDIRVRVGEVLGRVIQRTSIVPPSICKTIFLILRDKDPNLVSSAMILTSLIVKQSPEALTPYLYQFFDFIEGVLRFEEDVYLKRGGTLINLGCLVLLNELVHAYSFRLPTLIDAKILMRLKDRVMDIGVSAVDNIVQGHAKVAAGTLQQLFFAQVEK